MEYRDALNKITSTYGKTILKEYFLSFSVLSDYIGSSIYSKRLASIFFEINKNINLYSLFNFHSLKKARNILTIYFNKNNHSFASKEYVDAINPIAELLNPKEYNEYEYNKGKLKNNKTEIVNPKNNDSVTCNKIIKINSNKIVQKKSVQLFDHININISCKILIISTNNSLNQYEIYKINNNKKIICTSQADIKNKNMNISICDKSNISYYISLPNCKYKSLNINQKIGSLQINGLNEKREFECKEINLKVNKGKIILNCNSSTCNIDCIKDSVTLFGIYEELNINNINSDLNGQIEFKSRKYLYKFNCKLINGNVDLRIKNIEKHIGKHFFGKRRSYCGYLYVLNKKILMNMKTINGEINIKPV